MHIQNWFQVPAFNEDECDQIQALCDQVAINDASVIAGRRVIVLNFMMLKTEWLSLTARQREF